MKKWLICLLLVFALVRTSFCDTAERTLLHEGKTRTYLVHVPQSYSSSTATALVLGLHGYGGTAGGLENSTGLSDIADREGFIVVYPDALGFGSDGRQMWNAGGAYEQWWAGGVDDVDFLSTLIDTLSVEYFIDPARIFAFGISNGGFMAHHLGAKLPYRIAAVASCAGLLAYDDFEPGPPVSVIHFHGDSDSTVPYEGLADIGFSGAEEGALLWAQHNGCGLASEVLREDESVLVRKWASPIESGDVVLYKLFNRGHSMPNDSEVSAPQLAWEFFQGHPKLNFEKCVDDNGPVNNITQGYRFETLLCAVYYAQEGDILVVSPGLYDESVTLYEKNLTIRSTDPNDPAVTAQTIISGSADYAVVTLTEYAEGCTLRGLTITGGKTGLSCSGNDNTISFCNIVQNDEDGVYFDAGGDISFDHCIIADNGDAGIRMESGSNAAITNCTIANNAGAAVDSGRPDIKNSILYFNGPADDEQIDASSVDVEYSCVQGGADGRGNINADPLFIDSNYHISQDSLCVDAGNPSDSVGREPQPNGGRINMGAYGGTIRATKTEEGWGIWERAVPREY